MTSFAPLLDLSEAAAYGPETYYPAFFGFLGVACALIFCNIGAAYGTAKTGIGLSGMGVMAPSQVMKNIIPVIMSGVIGIYGLIVAVILLNGIKTPKEGYTAKDGFKHLAAGLSSGLSGLGSGIAIGITGDIGVRSSGRQDEHGNTEGIISNSSRSLTVGIIIIFYFILIF